MTTRRRSLRVDDLAGVSRALLTALAHPHKHECVAVQWILGRSLPALAVPNRLEAVGRESWLGALLRAPFGPPPPVDVEVRDAVRVKQSEPGWRAVGRIAVKTSTGSRERQLVGQIIGALRSAEAPGVRFWVGVTNTKRVTTTTVGWRLPLRLNIREVGVVSSFPVGVTGELPVSMVGSRLMAPSEAIRRSGLVVGRATYPGREHTLALTPADSLRHIHALGPSGVGKSTLLLNLIVQAMQAGRAVVVIEPKSDLIASTLARIPPERVNDVVLLDPGDSERPVGLNPLALHGRSPELVADQLLGMWHAMYASSWGPRTHDILGASLLTLARTPGMTIAALPRLLTDAGLRRRIVSRIADPIGLGPFWATYESWSEQQRAEAISPSMNKLRPLLLRPEMRAIVGQRHGFDLRRVFTERKILLVDLSKGLLGPETASLLGSIVVSQLWQAILGRVAIAPERRHPVLVVVDEFQDYLRLPLNFADALAQARGLGHRSPWRTSTCTNWTRRCGARCSPMRSRGWPSDCRVRTRGSSLPGAHSTRRTFRAWGPFRRMPNWSPVVRCSRGAVWQRYRRLSPQAIRPWCGPLRARATALIGPGLMTSCMSCSRGASRTATTSCRSVEIGGSRNASVSCRPSHRVDGIPSKHLY